MSYIYLDIKDLSKKRYQNNFKQRNLMKILAFFILTIIILAIIALFFVKIDVIIKTNGVIKNKKNISDIYNIKKGRLKSIIDSNKKRVQKGELLFEIDNNILIQRKEYLQEKVLNLKKEIEDLNQLKAFISKQHKVVDIESEIIKKELSKIKEKLHYQSKNIKHKNEEIRKLKRLLGLSVTRAQIKNEKNKFFGLKHQLEKYKKERLVNITNRIALKKDKILNHKNKIYNINSELKDYKIYSPINGKIQYIREYNKGDYVPSGIKIMKIIPDFSEQFKVELLIDNKDILKINEKDLIKYRISSYPYKEYGIAEGKILNIESDATNINNGNYMYKVEANINNYLIKGDNKKYVRYKNGMFTKASIVVGRRKLIYYVLEKLDFLD